MKQKKEKEFEKNEKSGESRAIKERQKIYIPTISIFF